MQAYVEGDVAAFEQLFDALAPALRRFFVRSIHDAVLAEDLVQSTFLKLHAARRRWRRGERVRPWVFAIAANVRADWHRRRARRAADEERRDAEEPLPPPGVDPVAELDARERDVRVHRAIEALGEAQRIVIHLHRFEGLGFSEIGVILGISEGAAKLRAFRAYGELRRRLSDLVEEDCDIE